LAIAEHVQNNLNNRLRLAVVVPTVVLMHQWYDELIERSNLPAHTIGRLGGGYKEDFKGGRRVLIAVLASAHKQLPKLVRSSRNGKRLMLVADECHRMGATEMSKVFETERAFSLGLSATPEREDDATTGVAGYDESVLGQQLGPIIYNFTLAQALELGVIPPFSIHHYGLSLGQDERGEYDSLSRSISDTQAELKPLAPSGKTSGAGFFQWLHRTASKGGDGGGLAARLLSQFSRRQALLHGAEARSEAVVDVLKQEFGQNPDARAILFHESIDEVMRLFLRLRAAGFDAIAEHSKLPDSLREEGLNLFRKGIAKVIVSARSLIEGFNVPATDVGIIVASSSSVRQRIQSLGRVLRRHRGAAGEEQTSCIYVLYARDTVDDYIYAKLNWDRTTGVEQNLYYHWSQDGGATQQEGPPRTPLPTDEEVDVSALKPGDEYPGAYEGAEYTCDTRGNIQNEAGAYAVNPGELPAEVVAVKHTAGRFRISPVRRHVLVRVTRGEEWLTLYVGTFDGELDFSGESAAPAASADDIESWLASAEIGSEYPFTGAEIVDNSIRFKSKRGGVLAKRVSGGEVFARGASRAEDPKKGADADRIVTAVKALKGRGESVSQLEVNSHNHVLYRAKGKLFFVCALDVGLEFST
jgi:superfamily II DNA or RNA helicase